MLLVSSVYLLSELGSSHTARAPAVKRAWLSMLFLFWAGECQDELDKWCAAVKPGEGRLAKCLGDELTVEGQAGSKGAKMSEGCKKELTSFKIQRSTNINMDLPLAKACKADAEKFCANKYEVGCQVLATWMRDTHCRG